MKTKPYGFNRTPNRRRVMCLHECDRSGGVHYVDHPANGNGGPYYMGCCGKCGAYWWLHTAQSELDRFIGDTAPPESWRPTKPKKARKR